MWCTLRYFFDVTAYLNASLTYCILLSGLRHAIRSGRRFSLLGWFGTIQYRTTKLWPIASVRFEIQLGVDLNIAGSQKRLLWCLKPSLDEMEEWGKLPKMAHRPRASKLV